MPLSHTLLSLVAVCAEGQAFFQVTRVPTLTIMVAGENEKSRIVTQSLAQLTDIELVGDIELVLQATATAKTPPSTRRIKYMNPPHLRGG